MTRGRQFTEQYKPTILRAVELYPTELIVTPDDCSAETLAQALRWAGRDLLNNPNWIVDEVAQTNFKNIWPLMVTRPDNPAGVVYFTMRVRLTARARAIDARIRLQRPQPGLPIFYIPPKQRQVSFADIQSLCHLVQSTSERQEFTHPLTPEQIADLETQYLGIAIVESAKPGTFHIV